MHARTLELLQHLDLGRRALLEVVDAIADRDARPAAGRWSATDVLSHLARTEGQIGAFLQRKLRRALADAPLPPAPDRGPVLATLPVDEVLDRRRKVEAPDFAAPDEQMTFDDAWSALERARERLRQVLLAGDGLDTSSLRQAHHVFGDLTFEQWIAFASLHERRHTEQLRELANGG